MASLILVRHSTPIIDPVVPANEWPLSEEGERAAQALAADLSGFSISHVLSSPERKARETASIIAERACVAVRIIDALREHDRKRGGFLPRDDFDAGIEALLANWAERVFGDETACEVFARVRSVVDEFYDPAAVKDVVLVTHGTALTIYASRTIGAEPLQLWKSLRTPCALVISSGGWSLMHASGAQSR